MLSTSLFLGRRDMTRRRPGLFVSSLPLLTSLNIRIISSSSSRRRGSPFVCSHNRRRWGRSKRDRWPCMVQIEIERLIGLRAYKIVGRARSTARRFQPLEEFEILSAVARVNHTPVHNTNPTNFEKYKAHKMNVHIPTDNEITPERNGHCGLLLAR